MNGESAKQLDLGVRYLPATFEANIKKKAGKKFSKSSFIFAAVCFLLVLAAGLAYAKFYFSSGFFPGTKIGSFSVTSNTKPAAASLLNKFYDKDREVNLSFNGKKVKTTIGELGIKYDVDRTLNRAYSVGRKSFVSRTVNPYFTVDYKKQRETLNILFPGVERKAVDASFVLKGNVISVKKGENSLTFDSVNLTDFLVKNPQQKEVELTAREYKPSLNREMLLSKLQDLKKFAEIKVVLKVNGSSYRIKPLEAVQFAAPLPDGETVKIAPGEKEISAYVKKLAVRTEAKSKPAIYFKDGKLSRRGSVGKKIDEDKAVKILSDIYSQGKDATVELPLVSIAPKVRYISKGQNYTTGLFPGKYIEVDLSSQKLYQIDGDNLIASYTVSTGKRSTPTPTGTYSINSKNLRAYSSSAKLYMPYWMAFIGSQYGIHELPEWANGYKEGQNHLGIPVSHGCIRLGVGAAKSVYNWADIGTKVYIHQ